MELLHAALLGFIQGVTEFLPVSSSAHLVVLPWLFHWKDPGLAFDVFLHLGTLLAIFFYFFKDWWVLIQAGFQSIIERRIGFDRSRQTFWFLIVGSIPAALAGYFLHDFAETLFRTPLLIAVMLAGVGFVMYWVDASFPGLKKMEELTMGNAVAIGFAQALAIIPGVSRSGATITVGRFLGLSREAAARFSFLLSFPITVGACLFELKSWVSEVGTNFSLDYCIVGFSMSLIFGLVSIHGLLIYLRNADLKIFAWYRLALAIVIIAISVIWKM